MTAIKGNGLGGLLLACAVGVLAACGQAPEQAAAGGADAAEPQNVQVEALRERVARLRERAGRIQDSNEIKRLQRAFGYYVDEGMWNEVADLFTEDATLEMARDGVYRGRERIREYFQRLGGGRQGLAEGQLNEHFQLMPVVTLSEDGGSAKGRWRAVILKGEYGDHAWWGEGPYENEYVKEDGVWKISTLRWFQTIMVPYEGGWAKHEDVNQGRYVSDEFPPDAPPSHDYGSWPETFLPPFHFDNPVRTYGPAEARETAEETQDVQAD